MRGEARLKMKVAIQKNRDEILGVLRRKLGKRLITQAEYDKKVAELLKN